ncbi:ROK family transcriptional regulator [Streptomyces sp. NA04227]|uniref:ROK family transcriptional regulator n=1 Tax=Streptomyces sp. NA04227 TaxID=2742136 RepID=UPI001C37724C|nr:ROK family transcriptional regulator [Streptomyces sp. NA04227]
MRRTNLGLLLQLLRDHGARSRSTIATESGLPKATVSSLIGELVERGLVREGEADRSKGVGRPGQTVGLDGTTICALGLEIDADYIGVLALDLQGTEIHRGRVALDIRGLSAETALGTVANVIRDGLAAVEAHGVRAVGICLATPGVVDAGKGTVVFAPNIGWRDVPVRAWLRERLGPGVPEVEVDNDARLATVAEHAQLASQGVTDLLLLTGEAGVAGGVITNGKLLRGHAGLAGEIGHAALGPSDEPCPCGRKGCWETMVGLGALLRRVADADDPVRDASRDVEERMAEVMRRAQDGDARTLGALDDIALSLAHGVSVLADILNPQVIALGGYFAYFGDYFVPAVEERLGSRKMLASFPQTEVTRSRLGFSAAAFGAAQFALDAVFQDPTLIEVPAAH